MYTYVWRYRVRPDAIQDFLKHYRPGGTWAQLFARAHGYLDTQLLADIDSGTVFVTIDRWGSRADHAAFVKGFSVEFEALDRTCASLAELEEKLGDFETK